MTQTHPTFVLRFTEQQLEIVTSDMLKPISRRWGGKGNEPKAACIKRIVNGLADGNAVRAALTGLSPEERAAFAILKAHGGVMQVGLLDDLLQAYGYNIAEQYGHGTGYGYGFGYERKTSLFVARMMNSGFLLLTPRPSSYSPYGNFRYGGISKDEFIYTDERFLAAVDWPLEVRPLAVTPAAPAPATSTVRRPQHILLDLLAVTRTLAELKELGVTKTGTLRAADLKKFAKRMGWDTVQSFDGHQFPDITAAIIVAWEYTKWLRFDETTVSLAITPEQFAQLSLFTQVDKLVKAFMSNPVWSELPNTPDAMHENVQPARFAVFHSLRALPDNERYYALPELMDALYDRIGETLMTRYDYQHVRPVKGYNMSEPEYRTALDAWRPKHREAWKKREGQFVEAMLTSWLYWLGVVELARSANDALLFRLTELGRAVVAGKAGDAPELATASDAPAWVVQPNYDIVVYLDAVSPAQLAFLEQHAERRQAEAHTAHYQLTRESVYRGLEGGDATVESVLETLRQGARTELPQNVEREMHEWAGQRERITITAKARLIAFPSAETRALALEAGLHGTPVGETYVLVKSGTQVKAALKAVFGLQIIPTIDYAQPPLKCLRAGEDGRLTLVEDTGDLLIRGQLARCAEPVDAKHWRITPASLATLRRAGVTPAALLALLNARVIGTVPPVLEIAIGNALGTRDTLQAGTAYLLRVTNKKLYAAITTSPMLQPFLLDVPGPDTIAIDHERLEEFTAKLEWLGVKLAPLAAVETRPDWQKTVRDAKTQQRRRERYY